MRATVSSPRAATAEAGAAVGSRPVAPGGSSLGLVLQPTPRLVALALIPAAASAVSAIIGPSAFVLAAWVIGLSLAGSDALRLLKRPPLTLHCEVPERTRAGAAFELVYRIEGAPAGAHLTLLDELPADLGGDSLCTWRAGRAAAVERAVLQREPRRRGVRRLGPWHVWQTSPLLLWQRRERAAGERQLRVLPHAGPVRPESLGAPRVLRELGLRPRRSRGDGTDFESLREYTPGDEPRKIDWRATARRGAPVVRDYQAERNHTVLLAIDCGRTMSAPVEGRSKLDHALSAAMALCRACGAGGDRVGLLAFDSQLRAWVAPQPARRALGPIESATLPLEPRPEEASYWVLGEILKQRQKKRALVVVLTDFVEGGSAEELEAHLAVVARRHCVLLVGLRDRWLQRLDRPAPSLDEAELCERLVLQDLDLARHSTLARIAKTGVFVLDADPGGITAPLLSRYLAIREAGWV